MKRICFYRVFFNHWCVLPAIFVEHRSKDELGNLNGTFIEFAFGFWCMKIAITLGKEYQ